MVSGFSHTQQTLQVDSLINVLPDVFIRQILMYEDDPCTEINTILCIGRRPITYPANTGHLPNVGSTSSQDWNIEPRLGKRPVFAG